MKDRMYTQDEVNKFTDNLVSEHKSTMSKLVQTFETYIVKLTEKFDGAIEQNRANFADYTNRVIQNTSKLNDDANDRQDDYNKNHQEMMEQNLKTQRVLTIAMLSIASPTQSLIGHIDMLDRIEKEL